MGIENLPQENATHWAASFDEIALLHTSCPETHNFTPIVYTGDGIFNLLRSPGIKKSNVRAYVAWQAGRYDNPIPTRFLAPIDCSKIRVQVLEQLPRRLGLLYISPPSQTELVLLVLFSTLWNECEPWIKGERDWSSVRAVGDVPEQVSVNIEGIGILFTKLYRPGENTSLNSSVHECTIFIICLWRLVLYELQPPTTERCPTDRCDWAISLFTMDGVGAACVFFGRHNLIQYTGGHKEMPAILDDQ